ncbi:MAG: PDZ domain-containing protein [Vicinamibacterales bacterium]
MKGWRTAALSAAMVAAAAAGAAVAPVAHGQTTIKRAPRAVEIFGGGSRIGISIRDIESAGTDSAKGVTAGVVVEDVTEDSPAAKAGIQKGDVIVEFDGERVRSARQLTRLVQETPSGRNVQAAVVRNGQRTTVTVTPGEGNRAGVHRLDELRDMARDFSYDMPTPAMPEPPAPPAPPSVWSFGDVFGRSSSRLGVTLSELSPQLAEYFGAKDGVLVSSVSDGSAAAKAGLKAGDVITSLNGSEVNDAADLRRGVQGAEAGDELTIGVVRDRKAITVKAKVEQPEPRRRGRTIL